MPKRGRKPKEKAPAEQPEPQREGDADVQAPPEMERPGAQAEAGPAGEQAAPSSEDGPGDAAAADGESAGGDGAGDVDLVEDQAHLVPDEPVIRFRGTLKGPSVSTNGKGEDRFKVAIEVAPHHLRDGSLYGLHADVSQWANTSVDVILLPRPQLAKSEDGEGGSSARPGQLTLPEGERPTNPDGSPACDGYVCTNRNCSQIRYEFGDGKCPNCGTPMQAFRYDLQCDKCGEKTTTLAENAGDECWECPETPAGHYQPMPTPELVAEGESEETGEPDAHDAAE